MAATNSERLMALDSASMYFRTFYGVPESVVAPDGTPVGAARGFLDAVARLVGEFHPTQLVAAFDADWRPAFRVELLASYKAHRVAAELGPDDEEIPDLLGPQVPIIEQVLDAVGIARFGVAGFEADDVLATLAEHSTIPTDVVTGDRDLFQLIDDEREIRVLYTGKGFAKLEPMNEAAVQAKYEVPARYYADFATLRGDPSDGLPGAKGIGDKSAAFLVNQFGTVEAMLGALDDPTADVPHRGKLKAARDYLTIAPQVVRVRRDVPLPSHVAALPRRVADPDALDWLADRWGLKRSVDRLLATLPLQQ
ncbi:MAG: 5'-3' exonuclease [Candidatus Nanopelagicales bacterium]